VDASLFHPGRDGAPVRRRYGLAGRPVILSVGRLVPRKGHDTLIRALPLVRREVEGAALLVVGAGPDERRLRRLADRLGVTDAVTFAGGVPHRDLPPYYAAADVFAMPCRTRRVGLDLEGLGIVFLEAAAAGLPVVAGDSGGACEALLPGRTGYLVDGRSVREVAERLTELLLDRKAARAMGARGREWVMTRWGWDQTYRSLAAMLAGETGAVAPERPASRPALLDGRAAGSAA
jgi:phosphatidylinositol alpha-1,6-mannosyltransferase